MPISAPNSSSTEAESVSGAAPSSSSFAPLGVPIFRNIWGASLLSNFGQLVLGVGAAWEMTKLSNSDGMVALVQTALMLPLMLVALPAGAFADMFDRRKVAMAGLLLSMISGVLLTLVAFAGLLTPWMLLGFVVLSGTGTAIYSPSWQASIGEQVSEKLLPAAVALGTISYNVARSFGPALGGVIVAALGAKYVFGMNAFLFLPLLLAYLFWKRERIVPRLPPERLSRAIVSGVRFASHSPIVRAVILRCFAFGLFSASATALAPLIARDMLGGDATVFGLLLGASGVGAVTGAIFVSPIRDKMGTEKAVRLNSLITAISLVVVGFSHSLPLTLAALFIGGAANILTIALMNITVQLTVPRWVTARSISLFSSAITGGIAIGSAVWGLVTVKYGIPAAMIGSGVGCALTILLGIRMPLPHANQEAVKTEMVEIGEMPDLELGLTARSGPMVIEIEYDVDPHQARSFYEVMMSIQKLRQRNGGFDWSISRDVSDSAIWIERYQCPTWGDYLHMRSRWTQADRDLQEQADSYHRGEGHRIRRMLDRPFGSVRWSKDTPDPIQGVTPYTH